MRNRAAINFILLGLPFVNVMMGCRNNSGKHFIIDPDYNEIKKENGISCNFGNVVYSVRFSGNSSVLLSKESPFGFTVDFADVNEGELFEVSVYRSGNDPLVRLVADGDWEGHYYQSNWHTSEKNGWQKIELRVEVPEKINKSKIRFYAYTLSSKECFVDSMVVKKYNRLQDSILPDYTFYHLLYEIINDYHLRNYREINFDSIINYSSNKMLSPILKNHSTTIGLFSHTFQHLKNKITTDGMKKMLHKMKIETHYPSVNFKWEEAMREVKVSGYIKNMFCSKNDTAKIVIRGVNSCKEIKLYKLEKEYKTQFVKKITIPKDSNLAIPCKQLNAGIYKIELKDDKSIFPISIFVNDTVQHSVAIIAPYSTWHAYNSYGGKSFYINNNDKEDVNFSSTLRPVTSILFDSTFLGHDVFILNNIYEWFNSNYSANIYPDHWLEAYPEKFKNCKTLVLAHHCEYFSSEMFKNLVALSKTKNLISLGGNQMYWKIKWNKNYTELECRKDGNFFSNSDIPGGLWRNQLTSEARILGVAFTDAGYATYTAYRVKNASH